MSLLSVYDSVVILSFENHFSNLETRYPWKQMMKCLMTQEVNFQNMIVVLGLQLKEGDENTVLAVCGKEI